MSGRASDDEGGFALIETIVAFLILATALAVAVETIAQSMKTVRRTDDLEAASQMLDQMRIGPLYKVAQPGISTGNSANGSWQMVVERISDDHARPLFGVTVTLWPRGETGPRFAYRTFSSGASEP